MLKESLFWSVQKKSEGADLEKKKLWKSIEEDLSVKLANLPNTLKIVQKFL